MSDRWAAQLKTKTKEKQLCLAHLLRDCAKLIDLYQSKWAMKMKTVLEDIFQLTELERIPSTPKSQIEDRLNGLFKSRLRKSQHEVKVFQKALLSKWRHSNINALVLFFSLIFSFSEMILVHAQRQLDIKI